MRKRSSKNPRLSELEHLVLDIVWELGEAKAEAVRSKLSAKRPLKESTVRTILKRLEAKSVLSHRVEKRTFIYYAKVPPNSLGLAAVKSIAEKFFDGSFRQLVLGMASHQVISPEELRDLSNLIDAEEAKSKKDTTSKQS